MPSRASHPEGEVTAMEQAFALAASADLEPLARDSEPRVGFATWDDGATEAGLEASRARRGRLVKYVKATMAGSILICVLALGRLALGGMSDDAPVAATLAKMRESSSEMASLHVTRSTLTARTLAALRVEQRREAAHARTASRAKGP